MNAAIDGLLRHWGDATEDRGSGAVSPIALAMKYGNVPAIGETRSTLMVEFDPVDEEVDAVLAGIGQLGRLGADLLELAHVRYRTGKELLVEQQMKRLGIRSDKTYRSRVKRLHELVQKGLAERHKARAA